MSILDRGLRRELEKAVAEARRAAEAGARQAVAQLAVAEAEAWPTQSDEQKALRRRLRAHARQLGDRLGGGAPACERLVAECAYEHWHRLLFARFLAESDLLIEPASGVAMSLGEVQELARERRVDWISLASGFAEAMLPQIFRPDDPVLEIALPPESRQALERILAGLPREVFLADDSLGWVYQYWQAETKKAVNESERKIGAEELPAVTQLFTEDYMVLFLLENTLGAWWAARHLAAHPELAANAESEEAVRRATSPAGIEWTYLRFTRGEGAPWRTAGGAFEGWPERAAELRVLDPCMGSGHFLVFALPILVAFRRAEEGLPLADALCAVLRDNLFGLELDPRCTQLAAFNLALAAWRMGGHRALPALRLACAGLAVNSKEEDWKALGGGDQNLRIALGWLYPLFRDAATLGSLVNPAKSDAAKLVKWSDLVAALQRAVAREAGDEEHELGVRAFGIAQAAEILASRFTLVATNVPYLGRGKQDEKLRAYCERQHPAAKADLATCFVERCLAFCAPGGTAALVTPQTWLFLGTYRRLRKRLLETDEWNIVVRLGEHGFESSQAAGAFTALVALSARRPTESRAFAGLDAIEPPTPAAKADVLRHRELVRAGQALQLANPDCSIAPDEGGVRTRLSAYAESWQGLVTGDTNRFTLSFWELPSKRPDWEWFVSSPDTTAHFVGRELVVRWEKGNGALHNSSNAHNFPPRSAIGREGVLVSQIRNARATRYLGEIFNDLSVPIIPHDAAQLPAILAFCSDPGFTEAVRTQTSSLQIRTGYFLKVPFDLAEWQKVAAEKYPHGLPKPHSDDPTQWLFGGPPKGSEHPLQVAVARLVGYRWPRQTGSSFPDCPALGPDGLEALADEDGIICLAPLRGEASAAERLRALLAAAYGPDWSPDLLNELLARAEFAGKSLDEWLRDGFFAQHCALFHQRPFVWQIWDGLRDGFSALVNYHRLAAPNGEGRRTLEKLIYAYLGDWIDRQRDQQKREAAGADARVAAAEHLKRELERILAGEPPYDLFVRWKPLHAQPIGWDPDLDDGVRLNVRPFATAKPLDARAKDACILRKTPKIRWDKDRGNEPSRPREEFPWFWGWDESAQDFAGGPAFDGRRWNDLHYSTAAKRAARERTGAPARSDRRAGERG